MNKVQLANLPTPIEKIAAEVIDTEKNLYIKRDDYTGSEISGNKIRKLEYCLKEALEKGCDTIITCGAIQSNHCRATAAACAKLGLDCHLILRGEAKQIEGNLFLDYMFGSQVNFIDSTQSVEEEMAKIAEKLEKEGRKIYSIPVGASNAVGSSGYVDCYNEILAQEKELDVTFDAIVLPVGSGGTYAGLWYGNYLNHFEKKIIGFSVNHSTEQFEARIQSILTAMDPSVTHYPDILINDRYIGEGYAKYTKTELALYQRIAQQTGIVFDPTYTGKAFYGLLNEVNQIEGDNILFIHTGGLQGWTQEMRDGVVGSI